MRSITDYLKVFKNIETHQDPRSMAQEPRNMADGGRIGYKDGEGVITVDDKIDEMISFYKDYLNQGGKMDFKTFSKKYIPENFADGGRARFENGEIVKPSASMMVDTTTSDTVAKGLAKKLLNYQEASKGVDNQTKQYLMNLFQKDLENTGYTVEDVMRHMPRNTYSEGQLVTPSVDGSRPGYKGPTQETKNFLNWLKNNKDFDFANSSSGDILTKSKTNLAETTISKILREKGIQTKAAIALSQDKPKYTNAVLAKLKKDLPPGLSLQLSRNRDWHFKVLIKGAKVNKPTITKSYVANEANKQIAIDFINQKTKEYYPNRLNNEGFKRLRLENKGMTTTEFAKFLNKEGKTTYLGQEWLPRRVSDIQSKLNIGKGTTGPLVIRTVDEAKKIIRQQPGSKFFFMTNPSDSEITQYASNLISQEKTIAAKGKHFPTGGTKETKMFNNFYESSRKSEGRMKLQTKVPIDADGKINWKMIEKNGLPAWKNAKFYDNKKKTTFTWGKDYKPGKLKKQIDAAYGDGFFAKSVRTYDEQAKWNKMTFKGRALNEWMREGLLQKEFELKFKRKPTATELKEWYALRKPSFSFTEAHHVEGVGKNPFRMELSYRAANRKQNDLLNKYKAGTLTKNEYIKEMENLSDTKGGIKYKTEGRFHGTTGTPERIVATSAKDAGLLKNKDFIKFFKGTFQGLSPQSVMQLAKEHGCGKKSEGGSIMSCLQGKFEKNPDKFLQRSAPLAKNNVNLFKWFKNGRKIARGTGVFAAWEAAFAPIVAGWMATEGESGARMLNEIAYGVPFIGETEKEEWMKYAGGDEKAYAMKRMEEMEEQEMPSLQYQLEQAQAKSAGTKEKVPGYTGYHEKEILEDIKEKEQALQKLYNIPEFWAGPTGKYLNEPVVEDAYNLAQQTKEKIAADKAARKEDYKIEPIFNFFKNLPRMAEGGRAGYMGGGIAAIRKPGAIAPTGGPMHQGLRSLYINDRDY